MPLVGQTDLGRRGFCLTKKKTPRHDRLTLLVTGGLQPPYSQFMDWFSISYHARLYPVPHRSPLTAHPPLPLGPDLPAYVGSLSAFTPTAFLRVQHSALFSGFVSSSPSRWHHKQGSNSSVLDTFYDSGGPMAVRPVTNFTAWKFIVVWNAICAYES